MYPVPNPWLIRLIADEDCDSIGLDHANIFFLAFKRRTAEGESFGPEVAICRYPDWQLLHKHVGELMISHLNFNDRLACSIC